MSERGAIFESERTDNLERRLLEAPGQNGVARSGIARKIQTQGGANAARCRSLRLHFVESGSGE